jgi:hypothetical protein
MSFGGRLAQIRAVQAWTSARRAWPSAEEFELRRTRPCRLRAQTRSLSPRAGFSRGERAGGVGPSGFRESFSERLSYFN